MRLVQAATGEVTTTLPNFTNNRGAEIMHKLDALNRRTQVIALVLILN